MCIYQVLDSTKIQQSHKHPTLCTVTVDGYQNHQEIASPPPQNEKHLWRLPSSDPRDEGKFLFRLHTVDLYFWTAEDANSFIEAVRKILDKDQLEVLDMPPIPAAHQDSMSPVVQQLESVAFTDPAYHNGQTRDSRAASGSFAQSPVASPPQQENERDMPKVEDRTTFQPLAYNPAAPAAPEPFKHREKTPPPPEAEAGTGLAAAAYHDQVQHFSPSPFQGQGSLPPSQRAPGQSKQVRFSPNQTSTPVGSSISSPPPSGYAPTSSPFAPGHRTSNVSTFPPPPPQSAGTSSSPYSQTQATSFAAPPKSPQTASLHSQQYTSPFSPAPQDSTTGPYNRGSFPPESPATEILGNSYIGQPQQPLQHLQPQYADYLQSRPNLQQPVGGYSDYQYNQPQQHHGHRSSSSEYDVHSQVYRPTEEEANSHGHRKSSKSGSEKRTGKVEQGADRIDKGVNRFFKKLEKKIG